jgi:hypothetical protein
MPFGLKNTPSKFQRIMNDIFNAYSKFCIIYIDDVLIFFNILRTTLQALTHIFSCYKTKWFSYFQINDFSISNSSPFPWPLYLPKYYYTITFANKFPNKIHNKPQLKRFLGSLNYVLDFYPNISRLAKPLHDRLRKNPVLWSDEHTTLVRQIKKQVKEIPCLYLANPLTSKIVEIDASDLGFGGILKQVQNSKEQILQFTSAHWNDCQKNYSTI